MDRFAERVQEMADETGYQEKLNEVLLDLSSADSKTSAVEKDQKAAAFETAAKKKRKVIAAERKVDGVFIAPAIGGKIVLSFLGKSKPGHEAAVHAEIAHRRIEPPEPLESMNWYPTLELLKIHELGILSGRPEGATLGGKAMTFRDVKDIVPQTAELKALLDEQNKWAAEKRKR